MLIRIAPMMFTDSRFGCVTLPEVRDEIFRTRKFKSKYPWRTSYKSDIVSLTTSEINTDQFDKALKIVRNLVETGCSNEVTGTFFDLSRVDQMSLLKKGFALTTGGTFLLKNPIFRCVFPRIGDFYMESGLLLYVVQ